MRNDKDIRPPYARTVTPDTAGPLEPVTYTFNEDVTGISNTSAPVIPGEGWDRFLPDDPPAAQPGNWSCLSSTGAVVDCGTGRVRTATWTPSQPLSPGQWYGANFNPEHVLDVTDLAGNPVDLYAMYEEPYTVVWMVDN